MGKACAATVQLSLCRDDVPGNEAVRMAKKKEWTCICWNYARGVYIVYSIHLYVYMSMQVVFRLT